MFKYLLASALLLAGCSGAVPWNKQNYAGLNRVHFEWCENQLGAYEPCEVDIIDGKEQGAIDFKFKMADGTVLNFAADDVRAFEGQQIRANVEAAIIEQLGQIAPQAMDAILAAVTGGVSELIPEDEPE